LGKFHACLLVVVGSVENAAAAAKSNSQLTQMTRQQASEYQMQLAEIDKTFGSA
jgi:hypothetical protein